MSGTIMPGDRSARPHQAGRTAQSARLGTRGGPFRPPCLTAAFRRVPHLAEPAAGRTATRHMLISNLGGRDLRQAVLRGPVGVSP
ncbi:hypothetical protein GCM10022207_46240 [Streptomyces lannensis]|uniref:Uncharacterized protein n=1 Tax=Streptomyces lannensis TaxID=766498 RepID=A0ABP7KH57_9ACTN